MLHLIPRHIPDFPDLLQDIGRPAPIEVARALGISERTAYRWQAGSAPRVARLALYWLTPWGWSAHESEARRRLADWRALAESRGAQVEQLRAEVARLQALGHGAANAPTMDERLLPAPLGAGLALAELPVGLPRGECFASLHEVTSRRG